MGSASSKFRRHLQNGDEYAALQLYQNNGDLRKALNPNSSYGDSHGHDTPLHYAARHGMKTLLKTFLYNLGGNPNKKNATDETVLHLICQAKNGHAVPVRQRRADCVNLVLAWKGAILQDGEVEKADLGATDQKLNIPLHYAAESGLKKCVELLVSHGSPLFVENESKETPCDSAERAGYSDIALFLESKMVFSSTGSDVEEESEPLVIENAEPYSGLRAQDLQEAKDLLLVETSDMLRIPLFTAEALLRNHEWSREMLLESWMNDPKACCEKCGVIPPASILNDHPGGSTTHDHELLSPLCRTDSLGGVTCDICTSAIPEDDDPVSMLCEHQFCRLCWEGYLNVKIQDGDAHNITCPGYGCTKLVPVEIIESVVSRDMARRYLQFDIKAFVDGNPNIKWCPFPGCGRAVRLPSEEDLASPLSPRLRKEIKEDTSRAVDCGIGHLFCWDCLGDAHEPCSCDCWVTWQQRIAKVNVEELTGVEKESETAANCLWLVTNSKPCPNCKSPIQKNEGCNHMKCSKCKHDFCWVCLEQWKKHSSATGGYFRCNRYEVSKKQDADIENQLTEAQLKNQNLQEKKKFVHYYTRFKNHENSYKLEVPLLSTAKNKMMELARAMHCTEQTASVEVEFVEEAIHQLLKARRVLKCSYVYGYYLEDEGIKKQVFESMQTELEECTETLSEMIARPYLRTPRNRIIQTAQLVRRKRHEFVMAISKGLVPTDFSGAGKKGFSYEFNAELRKSILESMPDHDTAKQPWARDPRTGRHANVEAILDWPTENDSDTDSDSGSGSPPEGLSELDVCIRRDCSKPRAKNPRTGNYHQHCSLRCLRRDRVELAEIEDRMNRPSDFVTDYQVDLLRALEMSRLQLMREMASIGPPGDSPALTPRDSWRDNITARNINPPNLSGIIGALDEENLDLDQLEEFDPEFQRALEMSRLSYQDEDTELRTAIELSLQDRSSSISPTDVAVGDTGGQNEANGEGKVIAKEIVETVNKSTGLDAFAAIIDTTIGCVESLDRTLEKIQSTLDAKDGPTPVETIPAEHIDNEHSNGIVTPKCSPFGLIKDLSVTNLLSTEVDKTESFQNKDFRQLYEEKEHHKQTNSSNSDLYASVVCSDLGGISPDGATVLDLDSELGNVSLQLEDIDEFGTTSTDDDLHHVLASIQNPGLLRSNSNYGYAASQRNILLPKTSNLDHAAKPYDYGDNKVHDNTNNIERKSSGRVFLGSDRIANEPESDSPLLLNNARSCSSFPQALLADNTADNFKLEKSDIELQSVIRVLENITSNSAQDRVDETNDRIVLETALVAESDMV